MAKIVKKQPIIKNEEFINNYSKTSSRINI